MVDAMKAVLEAEAAANLAFESQEGWGGFTVGECRRNFSELQKRAGVRAEKWKFSFSVNVFEEDYAKMNAACVFMTGAELVIVNRFPRAKKYYCSCAGYYATIGA